MTSSSTLARRARAEKNPAKAKKLRAQAAKLRREERAAKKPGKAASKIMKGLEQALDVAKATRAMDEAIAQGKHSGIVVGIHPRFMHPDDAANDAARPASPDSMPLTEVPWYRRENQIAALMKAVKKPEQFKSILCDMLNSSRYDGRSKALVERETEAAEINKRWAINFVSGFIARMNAEAKANGGPLPRHVVVDGVTMARVVDALEKAGYTADGVTGLRRAVG